MKNVILLLFGIVLIVSCAKKAPFGWEDNIKLSTTNVEFGVKADSVTISTEGEHWMIATVYFGDSTYSGHYREDIDFESYPYSIVGDNFVVERRDKNTLFVFFSHEIQFFCQIIKTLVKKMFHRITWHHVASRCRGTISKSINTEKR